MPKYIEGTKVVFSSEYTDPGLGGTVAKGTKAKVTSATESRYTPGLWYHNLVVEGHGSMNLVKADYIKPETGA